MAYEGPYFEAKVECRGTLFESVGDRDVADAAYRDVFTAVSKRVTRCSTAKVSEQSSNQATGPHHTQKTCDRS
ncbi:hypothetical protein HNQ53_000157 [Microbulbifer hydrolyticus]|uniref:Uncharacterized protein n=1 Tax=Microbulbifer hydrolyticus TaxID=48074 RepID=A0AA89P9P7_9GAMM|nr:hypothetical protein [Microbulbifer hydrolyticus]